MCILTYLPSPLTGILLPKLNRLLSGEFHIVEFVFGAEISRGCFSPCRLSRKLLLVSIEVSMNERRLVEHKGVCCLMFS